MPKVPGSDGARNQLEIRAFHLKRGGGHAILNWLALCAERPAVFLNCSFSKPLKVRLRGQRVFRRVVDPPPGERALYGIELDPRWGWRQVAEMEKELLLYNLENFDLARVPGEPLLQPGGAEPILGRSAKRRTLLILRDAFNTFASAWRGKRRMRRRVERFYAHQWKVYAREFLGETGYLPPDTVRINYNRWFSDSGYRLELAEELGLPRSDAGLDDVPGFGGGSSFSGRAAAGAARAMPVLERWRAVADDPVYRRALDAETIELSNRIFGDVTGGEIPGASSSSSR